MNLVINGAEAIGEDTNGTVLVTTGIQEVDEAYILTTIGPAEEITLDLPPEVRQTVKTLFAVR